MVDQQISLSQRIIAALPFVLPVLGGLLGVVYVNMSPKDFLNPFIAIALGVVVGRVLAMLLVRAIGYICE